VLILRSVRCAYESLGVSYKTAKLFATLIGSIFNIPITELPPERVISHHVVRAAAVRKVVVVMKSERSKSRAKLFSIEEIAECVGVCRRTVRRWIKNELLVVHRFNAVVRISEADFQTFLAAHRDH
jgi:excisionase family DNA binding protein